MGLGDPVESSDIHRPFGPWDKFLKEKKWLCNVSYTDEESDGITRRPVSPEPSSPVFCKKRLKYNLRDTVSDLYF